MPIPYYMVDVFAEQRYAGNQLAVLRTGALADSEMQAIARETKFSETTFILSDAPVNGGYDVRIFTPAYEMPFAGHPTLGTAYVIQQHIIGAPVDQVVLNLKVGQIPVKFSYKNGQPDELWMTQRPPEFGDTASHVSVATALGVSVDDLDTRYPAQRVSTGAPFLIVPFKSRAGVVRAKVEFDALKALQDSLDVHGAFLFCGEPYDELNTFNSRMLAAGALDGPEDPATGSANGCFAAYLIEHRYLGSDSIEARVEQGYEMKRPSLLLLQAQREGDSIRVRVGGKVVPVARGEWG
jgi:trans-2,3-dihydro-3-hydroxyanthranilate isomerase